jgi:hypothetical protein
MKVLIAGRHRDLMNAALAQVRDEGFEAAGYIEDEKIVEELKTGSYDVLAIGRGVEPDSKVLFRQVVSEHSPDTRVLEVYGPETLLPGLRNLR